MPSIVTGRSDPVQCDSPRMSVMTLLIRSSVRASDRQGPRWLEVQLQQPRDPIDPGVDRIGPARVISLCSR